MKGNKTKIEITKSDNLHFVTISIPKNEFLDGPELSILHYPTHLQIMFPTNENPAYFYKPCNNGQEFIEDTMFGHLDMEDFFTREFIIVDGEQS